MRRRLFLMPALWLCGWVCLGAGKKPSFHITFHVQSSPVEAPLAAVEDVVDGKIYYFKRNPDLTEANFSAFQPFPSPVGLGWGATFQLDSVGQKKLYMMGMSNEGALLKSMVNGTPVDFVLIDRVENPKTITIWQGLKPELIEMLDKKYKRIKPETTPKKPSIFSRKPRNEVQDLPLPAPSPEAPYNPY
jgi:hypothetical protein